MNLFSTPNMRTGSADPRHLAILRAMATVAVFALLGKLLSAGKEMAIAWRYGLAAEVDAYQFLYSMLSWPLGVWSSVLTAVLVPLAARMRELPARDLARFRAELLGLSLLVGSGLALLAWLAIRAVLVLGPGRIPDQLENLVASALPGLLVMLPLGVLTALQSAWMLSEGRHVNTLLDCVPTVFIGAAVLAVPGSGMGPLVWGTAAGCAFHLLALVAPAARARRLKAPGFGWTSPHWRPFWQGFGIMLAGQAFMSLTAIIDQLYAVALGAGSIATLGFANRVLSLVLALAAIAVSRATLPVFSQARPGGDASLHALAGHWARLMFAAGIAAMLLFYALGPAAIALLFERGRFTADDTVRVVEVFRFSLPQLPFYFASMVLVSYALSQRRYGLVFWSGLIGFGGKILGNYLLVPGLGVNGVALGTTFVYGFNALFFHLALRPARAAPPPSEGATMKDAT